MREREVSERVRIERGNFQEFSASSSSHSRKFAQDSQKRKFFKKRRTGTPKTKEHSRNNIPQMPSDTFLSRLPYFLVYPSHPEKFTEVIFGQFSSTLMSPIYVYWLCKCQPLLKILRIFLRKILGTRCGLGRNLEKERSSKQHAPVIRGHSQNFTFVSCVHFSSTWMSPEWNRINRKTGQGVGEQENSNRAMKIPGNFCKFCEPLEKIRARF